MKLKVSRIAYEVRMECKLNDADTVIERFDDLYSASHYAKYLAEHKKKDYPPKICRFYVSQIALMAFA